MKNFKPLFLLLIASVLFACDEKPLETTDKSSSENTAVEPTAMLVVEVKGMTCEMGCGGEIRKGLKHSGAVASTKFEDFDAEKEYNVAKILFDDNDIHADGIQKIIEGLNDGQFEVGKMEVVPIDKIHHLDAKSEANEKANVSMMHTNWEFPNLLELLTSLVM